VTQETEQDIRLLQTENEVLKKLLISANAELERVHGVAPLLPLIEALGNFMGQVAAEQKPLLTRLVGRTKEGEETPIVSLWAAYGERNPIDRIDELVKENARLKGEMTPPR
jgi:hypothetical protein